MRKFAFTRVAWKSVRKTTRGFNFEPVVGRGPDLGFILSWSLKKISGISFIMSSMLIIIRLNPTKVIVLNATPAWFLGFSNFYLLF